MQNQVELNLANLRDKQNVTNGLCGALLDLGEELEALGLEASSAYEAYKRVVGLTIDLARKPKFLIPTPSEN